MLLGCRKAAQMSQHVARRCLPVKWYAALPRDGLNPNTHRIKYSSQPQSHFRTLPVIDPPLTHTPLLHAMNHFVVSLFIAFCLLPLPTPARPVTHMLVARQDHTSRIDSDLIFGITFSLGGPNIFKPFTTPLNPLLSFTLRAARQLRLARDREDRRPAF